MCVCVWLREAALSLFLLEYYSELAWVKYACRFHIKVICSQLGEKSSGSVCVYVLHFVHMDMLNTVNK